MNIRSKLSRALAVLGILTITSTATISFAFADSYEETTEAHFGTGSHSGTQPVNMLDDGEIIIDEDSGTVEVPIPSPGTVAFSSQ